MAQRGYDSAVYREIDGIVLLTIAWRVHAPHNVHLDAAKEAVLAALKDYETKLRGELVAHHAMVGSVAKVVEVVREPPNGLMEEQDLDVVATRDAVGPGASCAIM